MNLFHIGDSVQYLTAQYAKSNRSTCRNCKQKIGKDQLRVGLLNDDDHYQHFGSSLWFHLNCFHFKPRHKVLQLDKLDQMIYGIQNLNPGDDDKVINYLKEQLENLKENKSGRKKKPAKKIQKQKKQVKEAQTKKSVKPKGKNTSKSVQKKEKTKEKSQDRNKTKPKVSQKQPQGRVTRATKGKTVEKKQKEAHTIPKLQKQKSKAKKIPKAKKKPAPKIFLTHSQILQYKQLLSDYSKLSNNELKDILQKNNQPKTGNKSQMAQRCADGKLFGRIPVCMSCGGGKLRFNRTDGTYKCPGFMEDTDFVNCGKSYKFEEIKRLEWIQ